MHLCPTPALFARLVWPTHRGENNGDLWSRGVRTIFRFSAWPRSARGLQSAAHPAEAGEDAAR